MRRLAFVLLIALLVFSGDRPRAQARVPPLKDLLRRVGTYVETYGEKASLVVGSEHYEQRLSNERGRHDERQIVAEFAIVHDETLHEWLGFRDVIAVDGKPIADHNDRLVGILTSRSNRLSEARALSDEGARFNIGHMYRNFNVPTTALFFFKPGNLGRFKFSERDPAPDGSIAIGFRETKKPTIIRTSEGGSVPSEGEIWVDPATGTIRRTRLRFGDLSPLLGARSIGTIEVDVTYALDDRLGMWLPETMREAYDVVSGGNMERETGRADYSNYRRFQTSARIK